MTTIRLGPLPRCLPALAWMGFIFTLSSLSAPVSPEVAARKVGFLSVAAAAHLGEYAILAALLLLALGRLSWRTAVLVAVFAVAYGSTDELHQRYVPGREASGADLALDGVGAVAGTIVAASIALAARALRRRVGTPHASDRPPEPLRSL